MSLTCDVEIYLCMFQDVLFPCGFDLLRLREGDDRVGSMWA